MRIDLEWIPPWPAEWPPERKEAAADRLVNYMTEGTLYESRRRLRVTEAAAVQTADVLKIVFTLED